MSRSLQENARLDRLASEVKGGGGLPLPLFFSAILEELLDNGPADDARLTAVITTVGKHKSQKVAETWGPQPEGKGKPAATNDDAEPKVVVYSEPDAQTWAYLTSDLVRQLAQRKYVTKNDDGKWAIGEKFTPGVRLETIPKRPGLNAAEGVTVWTKQDREAIGLESKTGFDLAKIVKQPRGHIHNQGVIKELHESYNHFGPIQPVIKDAHGRTLDGRHRLNIDPEWPPHRLEAVVTDEQAVQVILELDRWHPYEKLSLGTREKIEGVLGKALTQHEEKRLRIEKALRDDAARSNRAIAEAVRVGHPFVGEIREAMELDSIDPIHHYVTQKGGKDGGGKAKHSTDCWCPPDSPERQAGDVKPKPSTPKQPEQSNTYLDPAMLQFVGDFWDRIGSKPTGPEMAAEAEKTGFTIVFQGENKVPAQNTFLRALKEIEIERLKNPPQPPAPESESVDTNPADESEVEQPQPQSPPPVQPAPVMSEGYAIHLTDQAHAELRDMPDEQAYVMGLFMRSLPDFEAAGIDLKVAGQVAAIMSAKAVVAS